MGGKNIVSAEPAERDLGEFRKSFPGDTAFYDLSYFFKVFGDYTRIRIIFLLSRTELCVGEIACFLELEQSAVSHQLRILKNARLVKQRRDGKSLYYSLDDGHVGSIIEQGFDHIMEKKSL